MARKFICIKTNIAISLSYFCCQRCGDIVSLALIKVQEMSVHGNAVEIVEFVAFFPCLFTYDNGQNII